MLNKFMIAKSQPKEDSRQSQADNDDKKNGTFNSLFVTESTHKSPL